MALDIITYARLFDFSKPQDVQQAIKNIRELGTVYDKLISSVEQDKQKYVKAVNEIVTTTSKLSKSRKDLDITTEKGRESTLQSVKDTERQFETFQKLNGAIKVSDDAIKKLNKEKESFNQKSKETLRLEKEEARLKERLASLNTKEASEVAKLRAQITAKNAALKQSAKESLGLISIYDQEVKKLNQLRNNYKNVAAQYGVNSRQARILRTELTQLDNRIKGIDASAGQFQRNVGNYRSALSGLAGGFRQVAAALGFTGLIFAIVGAFRGAIRIFRDFQKENAILAGVLGKTRAEITPLTRDAERLGATTARTSTEVTKLQIEYARLGFTQDEILNLTESTINGSIALNSELSRTAALVGAVVRTFDDLESVDAPEIVDKLTLAAQRSALSFSKLETALPIVSGAANAVGLELSEVLSVLGKLSDAGIDASTSATAFRNILIESASRGKNYKELLDQVRNSTNQLTTAYDLFGKRGAVQAVILANNTSELEKLNKELSEEFAGKAGKAAAVQLDTVSGAALLAKSAIEGFVLAIENGDGALSAFAKGGLKLVAEAFNALANLDLVLSTVFKRFRQLDDEQILRLIDAGLVTESGKNVKEIISQLDSIPIEKLTQNTEEYRDRIISLFVSEGESSTDAQRIFSVYFNERKRQYSALQQAQGLFTIAITNGIDTFDEFQQTYGKTLDQQKDGAEVLEMVQKKFAEAEKERTDDLLAGLNEIKDVKGESITQLKEELKILKERLLVVTDVNERERIRDNIKALEEQIKTLEKGVEKIDRFRGAVGLLTTSLRDLSREDRNKELEKQIESIEDIIGPGSGLEDAVENFKKKMKETELVGVEVPKKMETAFDKFTAKLRQAFTLFGEYINAGFEIAGVAVNQFFTNAEIRRQNALAAFEESQQMEIDAIEARRERELENEQLTADQKKAINQRYAAQIDKIESEIERKRREAQRKQSINAKAQAALNVALNTAQAVTAALASVPPNIPLSIAVGVIGGAQLAAVLSQPIPAYAEGTPPSGHPGGPATIGEGGKSETVITPDGQIRFTKKQQTIDLPEGTHVLNHSITQQVMKGIDKDYEAHKSANEAIQKAQGNTFNQKAFQQFYKAESDYIVNGVSNALRNLPINNWGFTDKGQVARSVRKGSALHKKVRLDNKY